MSMSFHIKFVGVLADSHHSYELHTNHTKDKNHEVLVFDIKQNIKQKQKKPSMTLLRQPCTMQKRSVRQIPRADRYTHAMPFISIALNIPKLYTYSFQIFLYKYHNQELPNILQTSLWQMKHFMNMIPDKEINSDLHWLGAIRGQEQ